MNQRLVSFQPPNKVSMLLFRNLSAKQLRLSEIRRRLQRTMEKLEKEERVVEEKLAEIHRQFASGAGFE